VLRFLQEFVNVLTALLDLMLLWRSVKLLYIFNFSGMVTALLGDLPLSAGDVFPAASCNLVRPSPHLIALSSIWSLL
jgi:hypothetical protein